MFHLKVGNDQTFPQILSSPAGPIVDEDVFSADALTPDADIVDGQGLRRSVHDHQLRPEQPGVVRGQPGLPGPARRPKTDKINVKYYADASNLKLDIQEGNIDVAFRSLSATDIDDLRDNDKVAGRRRPRRRDPLHRLQLQHPALRREDAEADPAKALAVRQAVADLIDREEISDQVYKGTYTPLYSFVPEGLTGATESLKDLYGDGNGGPDADKAKQALTDAGVTTPVELSLQYTTDHYGPSSGDEYALIKDQLESSGLFKVNLQTTEWVQYSKDRVADVYPAYQLGWFPDYSDADNYLTPFFLPENFLQNHYDNPQVNKLIQQEATHAGRGAAARSSSSRSRTDEAEDLVDGAVPAGCAGGRRRHGRRAATKDTLDASFKFRYGALSKG